ncbi:MAG: DUF2807 domain-containing protein [Brevundimonas sp.]|uniref:GIN domain-containing protein n=1 Tax=Brevundimonas sp. TaxID=1871086 RepID=UPI002735B5B6|nr:DUF2807 domain-containing protein [Brevundimonas sp.]MDP3404956.1 DUF2807 domain-containing protein [Brevundimonas sp.]
MIRTLFIIAVAGLVLATASIGGAFALGGRDLARNGWAWTFHDENGENVRFERVRGGGPADLGPVVTRTLAWDGGQSLSIEAALTVEYVQGTEAGVVITGPSGLAERVRLENGRLWLDDGDERVVFGWNRDGLTARSERNELRIVVTAPNINAFDLEGSGDLTLTAYDQDTLTIDISGSGEVEARGRTRALELDISGSGDADLSDLVTTDANVAIAGSGDARVAPTGKADITISGSGDVDVTTRPTTVNQNVSGSGDVSVG